MLVLIFTLDLSRCSQVLTTCAATHGSQRAWCFGMDQPKPSPGSSASEEAQRCAAPAPRYQCQFDWRSQQPPNNSSDGVLNNAVAPFAGASVRTARASCCFGCTWIAGLLPLTSSTRIGRAGLAAKGRAAVTQLLAGGSKSSLCHCC